MKLWHIYTLVHGRLSQAKVRYLWDTGMRVCPHLFCARAPSSVWQVREVCFAGDLWRKCTQIWPVWRILWPWISSFPSATCRINKTCSAERFTQHCPLIHASLWRLAFWKKRIGCIWETVLQWRVSHICPQSKPTSVVSRHAANPCLETSRNRFTHCSWKEDLTLTS